MFCHSTSEHILRLHQTLLLLVATVVPGVAQVTVDQSLSMEEYVGLLLGEGVTASTLTQPVPRSNSDFFKEEHPLASPWMKESYSAPHMRAVRFPTPVVNALIFF